MSTIRICQIPGLSNDYRHTIYFESLEKQKEFFTGKVAKTFEDYTYLRKNWSLKVKSSIDVAETWNYLYFVNKTKWYFYFITDAKYISENTVELVLEMDVMQTYMFDYNLQPCFVDREHTDTDYIGDHTIDEGLELGHYKISNMTTPELFWNRTLLVMSTVELDDDTFPSVKAAWRCDGVTSPCAIYQVRNDVENGHYLIELLDKLNTAGKTDAIVSIWEYPTLMLETLPDDVNVKRVTDTEIKHTVTVNRPQQLETYEPKNNKLYCYPYMFAQISNNAGNSGVYRFERGSITNIEFRIEGSLFPDGGVKAIPSSYNGASRNYEESLSLTGFPTVPWSADTYKIWLAQNQNQNNLAVATAGGSALIGAGMTVAGALTANPMLIGGGLSMAGGGMMSVFNHLAQQKDMETTPPQARGASSSTLNASTGMMSMTFYSKTISAEYAKSIDDFFTMYGYKTNRVKVPNRHARQYFTYTKTANAHVIGNICNADIQKIQSIYNNGITFWDLWNSSCTIGNYSVDNTPLNGGD